MNKIYMVSLDDEVPLSDIIENKMKILCYLVYDEIRGIEYEQYTKILLLDKIMYNELLEKKDVDDNDYTYRFEHEDITDGKFEPFMIDKTSFAFTIVDDKLSENELKEIIESKKNEAGLHYSFTIDSVTYENDLNNKNRLIAIKKLITKKQEIKKGKYVKIRTNPFLMPFSLKFR